MLKISKGIFLNLLLTLLFSFNRDCKAQPHSIVKANTLWKNDSLGCNGSRTKAYRKIFNERSSYYGLTHEEIIQIFGKPNESANGNFSYIIQIGGDQCDSLRQHATIKSVWSRDLFVEAYFDFVFDVQGKLEDISYVVI